MLFIGMEIGFFRFSVSVIERNNVHLKAIYLCFHGESVDDQFLIAIITSSVVAKKLVQLMLHHHFPHRHLIEGDENSSCSVNKMTIKHLHVLSKHDSDEKGQ